MKTGRTLAGAAVVLTMTACAGDNMIDEPPPAEDLARFERVTEFDGRILEIALPRPDGTRERFNTFRDEMFTWSWVPPLRGFAGRRWSLLKTTPEQSSMVYALVSWNNDDPTDYLAAGWWLRFPNSPEPRRRLSLMDAEGSMFLDGPELDISSPPQIPDAGEATYVGGAGGLFQYRYGSDWTGVEETDELEEFVGTMTITADFSEHTLRGCIGCVGDIDLDREHLYVVVGYRRGKPAVEPRDYEVHFDVTELTPRGTFVHDVVRVTHPERTVTESSGYWDGRLSNLPDSEGYPRLVAGSADVEFVEADGSEGRFQGLYTVARDELLPAPPDPNPDN